jgi:DNA-binding HxlR family transcriptional regulator
MDFADEKKVYEIQECKEFIVPVRDFLDLINGKWKIPIIVALSFGTRRFKELERDIAGITPKMLSKELSDLEQNQLISRAVLHTVPMTVAYTLTEYGESLDKIIADMRAWGKNHRKHLFPQESSGDAALSEES